MKINKLLATAIVVSSFACCCSDKAAAERITVESEKTVTLNNQTYENMSGSSAGSVVLNYGTINVLSSTLKSNTTSSIGGAIENYGSAVITNSTFNNNSASEGGAIDNYKYGSVGSVQISGSSFSSNTSTSNGGAISNYYGTVTVSDDSTFTSNTATYSGGAIYSVKGILDIDSVTFDTNTSKMGGAIGYEDDSGSGTSSITNSTFKSNSASTHGGAIWILGGSIDITDSSFEQNHSNQGGAIASMINSVYPDVAATVNISNSEFLGNYAATAGAIANFRTMNITDSTFENNYSTSTTEDEGGGALYLGADSETYISGSTFTSNSSAENGGAISTRLGSNADNSDAILDIIDSTFTNNTASQNGGAIYNTFYGSNTNYGYVTVSGSTFTSNSAANGGAIYNSEIADKAGKYASIYIDSSTFTSNSATSGNGGALYNSANTQAEITNSSFYSNSALGNGGAIYTAADLTINSTDGYQTVFSGNSASSGKAIYVDSDSATLTFNLSDSASVLLEDDINGVQGYNVNISGDSTSTTFYLYNDITNADVTIGNTTLNTLNNEVYTYSFNSFSLSDSINMAVDVDLANESMDKFVTNGNSYPTLSSTLTVSSMNALSDATKDSIAIYFAEDGLKGNVASGVSSLYAPIYKYTVSYEQRNDGGYFVFSKDGYNPSVLASSVAAQLGGYLVQLNSYDEAFRNMDMYMLMTKKQRQALKNANKYAAADSSLVFSPLSTPYTDKAGWIRPYTTFESVGLKNGPDVSNVAYGMYGGLESEMYDLGNGWDGIYSIYAGYNGSHQAYQGNSIYQNGGTLGIVGMAYKDNFFTGLTVNVGANTGQAYTMYGKDDFSMLMAGIASKTGYNYELADGKFIIQPHFLMSYSFVNTFDYTSAAKVRIDSDPLHAIQLEPGIKFIGNFKNGWQPYAGVSVVWNIMDKTQFKANDVTLPELSIKPYAKYGIGVRKTWGEIFVGYLQAFLTNGGRNGIGIQAGFRWNLGKDPAKYKNSTSKKEMYKS